MKITEITGICGFEVVSEGRQRWFLFLIVEARNRDLYRCSVRLNAVSRFESREEVRRTRDLCLLEVSSGQPIDIKTDEQDWTPFYPLRDFNWEPAVPKKFRVVARRINKPKRKGKARKQKKAAGFNSGGAAAY